ncbi:MAG: 30S ribosomal protein S10 [Candidatus Aenigmarchaeota archaeon]|nr:30S ribosomal protein S10 [Candidatus Aenigmarchaeota archaeon]
MVQTARIKLAGKDPKELDSICTEIKDMADKAGVVVRGPIPLPTKTLKIPVMKTPCGDGMHRGGGGGNWEHWEMRIHKRILDVAANERVLHSITRIRIPRDVNIEIELTG